MRLVAAAAVAAVAVAVQSVPGQHCASEQPSGYQAGGRTSTLATDVAAVVVGASPALCVEAILWLTGRWMLLWGAAAVVAVDGRRFRVRCCCCRGPLGQAQYRIATFTVASDVAASVAGAREALRVGATL